MQFDEMEARDMNHEGGEPINPSEKRCRVCGCTDDRACCDPNTGHPCYWVEDDLCSACTAESGEG